MSAPPRRCRSGRPASPPDSCASARRTSASRRPASSSLDSSAVPRVTARGRALATGPRRAAGALLALALTLGLAAPAGAQTIDSTTIVEGETKTFTVTGIPASWGNAEPFVDSRSTGSTTSHSNAATCAHLQHWPNWDVCRNTATSAQTWDSSTRTFTFELQARADSVSDAGETAVYRLEDSTGSYHQDFTITINEPPTLSIDLGQASVTEGDSGNTDVTINYRMDRGHSAQFPFLACVDTTSSTATHRTASGSKAADWNLVHRFDKAPVSLNAQNCHTYNYPANTTNQMFSLRVFGDQTAHSSDSDHPFRCDADHRFHAFRSPSRSEATRVSHYGVK